MLKCKINPEFNVYNTEQMFGKNINFEILLGGGVHSFNALIYNRNSIKVKRYSNMSTQVP